MVQINSKQARFLPLLLLGILSMVFAEVFSGSSPLWFLNPLTIILAFFLYWGHILFFLNLALKYNRASMTHLYLWGILFGLYESWITKVVWAGYIEEPGPGWGTFLGFAIAEFMIIGLFWHAFFSFIVPILAYEIIILSTNSLDSETLLLNDHSRFLLKTKKNTILFYLLFIIGSLMMPLGLEGDLGGVLVAAIVNPLMIVVLVYIGKKQNMQGFSLKQVHLQKRGLILNSVYLIILYSITFFLLLPERIPGFETILLTIGFYIFILILIRCKPPSTNQLSMNDGIRFTIRDLWNGLLLFIILSILWLLVMPVLLMLGTLVYLGMVLLGPLSLIVAIIITLQGWLSQRG